MIDIDDIDLAEVAERIRRFFQTDPPVGYLRGRTAFRDAVIQEMGCSSLEAEELIDTMEAQGYLHFEGDPSSRSEATSSWSIETLPPDQR